jgi:transcriptional antiterminator NusG
MTDDTTPADAPAPEPTPPPAETPPPEPAAHEPERGPEPTAHAPEPDQPPVEPTPQPPADVPAPAEPIAALAAPEEHLALPGPEEHPALPEHAEVAAAEVVTAQPEPPAEATPAEPTPEPVAPEAEAPPAEPAPPKAKPERTRKSKAAASTPAADAEPAESVEPAAVVGDGVAGVEPALNQAAPDSKKKWYVVKVQSGREESIKAAIERKVKIEGLEEFYGQIAIPVEEFVEKKKVKVKDKKTGEKVTQEKNVTKTRKKYPGYLFAEVEFNENILYLFRETSGVGDFVGAAGPMKPPPPMNEREVIQMQTGIVDPKDRGKQKKTVVKLEFEKGDKVKIRDGPFANMEGEVKTITEPKDATETPKVTVVVSIFGRPVDVELEYWHVDKA